MSVYLGIDFSGTQEMWDQKVRKPNVWIAEVIKINNSRYKLTDLRTVQQLEGGGKPYSRLISLLRAGNYEAAGIDAPFSIPKAFLPKLGHKELLESFSDFDGIDESDFPAAEMFFKNVTGQTDKLSPPKPLRCTEQCWASQNVNVRSTLWVEPRGGSGMTSACLTLLHKAQRPIWPWSKRSSKRLLVEAFPAAQLKVWGMPHTKYNGDNGSHNRKIIVKELSKRISFGKDRQMVIGNADALDAVICAFAAIAVKTRALHSIPLKECIEEGWIAVHI